MEFWVPHLDSRLNQFWLMCFWILYRTAFLQKRNNEHLCSEALLLRCVFSSLFLLGRASTCAGTLRHVTTAEHGIHERVCCAHHCLKPFGENEKGLTFFMIASCGLGHPCQPAISAGTFTCPYDKELRWRELCHGTLSPLHL